MKKHLVVVVLLGFVVSAAYAAPLRQYFTNKVDAVFAWEYDVTANPDIAGFKLYRVLASTPTATPSSIDIPVSTARTFSWENYPIGQHIHWMTAYDKYGNESDLSEQIQVNKKTIKPGVPTTFRISNPSFTITMP